jgi:hypothetical protein
MSQPLLSVCFSTLRMITSLITTLFSVGTMNPFGNNDIRYQVSEISITELSDIRFQISDYGNGMPQAAGYQFMAYFQRPAKGLRLLTNH